MEQAETRYAKTHDGVHIAYQVFGDGPMDVVHVPGFVSHLDLRSEIPGAMYGAERLARIARYIVFDKRGTGLSDRDKPGAVDERMEDIRAVMDAVNSEKAVIYGYSEGGPMALLFSATYPERTRALVIAGSFARYLRAPDYPFGMPAEAFERMVAKYEENWGNGLSMLRGFMAAGANQEAVRQYFGRIERMSASPSAVVSILQMESEVDVRHVLGVIRVPTLVTHVAGDPVVRVEHGRYLAEHIPGAKYVELEGEFHSPVGESATRFYDEIEEFLTGSAPVVEADRFLATVLFTDIVNSTSTQADLGDQRWRQLLDRHDDVVRREVERHRGRQVKSTGDGVLATFDGPARAIRCTQAIVDGLAALGLDVRAGLHTGEIELRGDDVSGLAVTIGRRVCDSAGAGDVVVSSTVKDLVAGSGIMFVDYGTRVLKGVPDEWRLFAVQS